MTLLLTISVPSITGPLQDDLQESVHNNSNVDRLPRKTVYFVPKLMVANTMSLAPKILEVQEFVLRNNVSLAFITETWLKSTIVDSIVDIPGYNVIRRGRSSEDHGGVCLYIKEGFSRCKNPAKSSYVAMITKYCGADATASPSEGFFVPHCCRFVPLPLVRD